MLRSLLHFAQEYVSQNFLNQIKKLTTYDFFAIQDSNHTFLDEKSIDIVLEKRDLQCKNE